MVQMQKVQKVYSKKCVTLSSVPQLCSQEATSVDRINPCPSLSSHTPSLLAEVNQAKFSSYNNNTDLPNIDLEIYTLKDQIYI